MPSNRRNRLTDAVLGIALALIAAGSVLLWVFRDWMSRYHFDDF